VRGLRRRPAPPHCRCTAMERRGSGSGSGAAAAAAAARQRQRQRQRQRARQRRGTHQVGDAQLVVLHVELEEDGVQAPVSERAAASEAIAAGGGRNWGRRREAWLAAQG